MPRLSKKLTHSLSAVGVMLLALAPTWSTCAPQIASSNTAQTTQALVFLRAEHPVFVRLTVLVDGQELRSNRDERLRTLFSSLDTNQDGIVDQPERDSHPAALRMLGVSEKWPELLKVIDRKPQDEKISEAELTAFGVERFGAPVQLARRMQGARRSSQAVELFDLLDKDENQRLSESEFAGIEKRLHKLDADGDDAFSVIEVEPFRNPFGPRVRNLAATPEESPWALAETAAENLLKVFDHQSPKELLNAVELGIDASTLATGDVNQDGQLSVEELRPWLLTVAPHYTLTASLPQRKSGQSQLTWTAAAAPPPANPRQRPRPTKNVETLIAGQPLQLQVSASKGAQSDNLAFYKNRFRRSDQDKNKYLNPTEFASMALPGATFEIVDADGNGEVHENELQEFLNLETLGDQGHVMLTYHSNEVSLFSLLDLDQDKRLSPRECQKAGASWQTFDHNHDGKLERQELSGTLHLTVELVKPVLLREDGTTQGNMTGEAVVKERTTGPIWFRGMDHNRDGDISRREFLGNDQAFKKWDRDGDGLINVTEAEGQ